MNTGKAVQQGIHSAELLICGCRVDPRTGTAYALCASHRQSAPTEVSIPKKDGLRALCPTCASQRIFAVGINAAGVNLFCCDCNSLFAASQIVGYGQSDDSVARRCDCGVVHDGLMATCFRCTQQEVV